MHCHACGREAPLAPGGRVGFRDECEACASDLHTCRNCAHYDEGAYNECREPRAQRVLEKERANRCDEFAPGAGEGATEPGGRERALSDLDRLFRK